MALTDANFGEKPRWVKDQRNSWHGVDYPYHSRLQIDEYYKRYCETLLAVDEGLGKVLDALAAKGWLEDTLIIYMGDNGFCFGEHGLIDKRTAYEASMRVPLLAYCPKLFAGGQTISQVVANIDVGPTVLEAAGLKMPPHMHGRSFLGLLKGETPPWRDGLLYEYYWERNFPQTPTMHALRTADWKYIRYQGIWDTDELYDLRNDALEQKNLIHDPAQQQRIRQMKTRMFNELEQTGGMYIPLNEDKGGQNALRSPEGAPPGDFPPWFYEAPRARPMK
jgi:N-acetylglucosamine-6-sulfatase